MVDEKTPETTEAQPAGGKTAAKAKKAKKAKPPALEDKPFNEFIQLHFLPTLETALKEEGLEDIQLSFQKQSLGVIKAVDKDEYWHVRGQWQAGRQFNIAFTDENISGQKLFYFADRGGKPSTIEQFMGDERKVNLDLMVLYTLQRLNGQKWLTRN